MKMKRKVPALLLAAAVMWTSLPVRAQEDAERIRHVEEGQVIRMLTTAYHHGSITAAGNYPRRGICAVRKEWVGKTALVWKCTNSDTMGEFLGIWECLDTGFGADSDGDGMGSIQEGRVIDMYFPTPEEVREWMEDTGGRVYVQLVDAEG